MTQTEIIDMARQAGFVDYELDDGTTNAFDKRYKAFAKLVAEKAIKESLAQQAAVEHELAESYRTELDKLSQRNYELRMENAQLKAQPKEPEQEPVAWEQFYPDIGKPKFVAQTEQEPVADVLIDHEDEDGHAVIWLRDYALENGRHLLYTTPPQRKPLTETQINDRARAEGAHNADFWLGVRFAEAEHGIKE